MRIVATLSGWRCYVDAGSLLRFEGGVATLMLDDCYVFRGATLILRFATLPQECRQSSQHCRCKGNHVPKESCELALQIAMKQRGCRGRTDEKIALEALANQAAFLHTFLYFIHMYITVYIDKCQ